jgi:hypothetical protein
MFAVQNAGAVDQFTVSDAGVVNEAGLPMMVGGKIGITLSNAPTPGPALAAPYGPFHVATKGNALSTAAFLAQNVTTGAGAYAAAVAPSFSFYRVNQNTADNSYVLPLANNNLGSFIFGTLNTTQDPNLTTSRVNVAGFAVRAESNFTSVNVTPTFFVWSNTTTGGTLAEVMRLSSTGNLGIGTTGTPTSKLQVVGLQVSDSGPPAGLTSGAFYRTSAGVVMVVP